MSKLVKFYLLVKIPHYTIPGTHKEKEHPTTIPIRFY